LDWDLQVRELETKPVLILGHGLALSTKFIVELERRIMDGFKTKSGVVFGLSTVKNPISLARLVMEKYPHIYLSFNGDEEFAREKVQAFLKSTFSDGIFLFTCDNIMNM